MIEHLKSLFLLQMGPRPYNLAGLITFMVALFIISLLIGSFFFWVGLKLVGTPESKMGFGGIIVTWLVSSILIAFIPILGCILAWYFIKIRHTDSWGMAIVAWFIAILIPIVIVWYLSLIGIIVMPQAPTGP